MRYLAYLLQCCLGLTLLTISYTSRSPDYTKRDVVSYFNCSESGTNVGYTRADGKSDRLHYVSSTYGIPTLLIARTKLNTTCQINCKSFASKEGQSVVFSSEPLYVYSLSFTKVYEYNDKNDTADLHDETVKHLSPHDWRIIDLRQLNWTNITTESDLKTHTLKWSSSHNDSNLPLQKKGSLSFRIETYDEEGRNSKLPRLLFDGNGSHIFFSLDNLQPSFEKSRYALEMSLISVDHTNHSQSSKITPRKSLDDEYTPGVFDTFAWMAEKKNELFGAYLQWKPVCYTNPKPSIQKSTEVKSYDVIDINVTEDDFSVSMAYFGLDNLQSGRFHIQSTNVSFGLSKDKFYNIANYTEWTFAMGYGTPPDDHISGLIITIISVGLGIPVVLVIIGSIVACVKKFKSNQSDFSSSYTAIQ